MKEEKEYSIIKIFFIILIVFVLVSIIILNVFEYESVPIFNSNDEINNNKIFSLLDGNIGYYNNNLYCIDGYIQNNTNNNYNSIEISFDLYDKNNNALGIAIGTIDILTANNKEKFNLKRIMSNEQEVTTYKLKDIKGYYIN